MSAAIAAEIDRNFDSFQRSIGAYLPTEQGKFALLRHGQVIGFFETAHEAERAGEGDYPDDLFSIQQVTADTTDLGFFTHAFDHG